MVNYAEEMRERERRAYTLYWRAKYALSDARAAYRANKTPQTHQPIMFAIHTLHAAKVIWEMASFDLRNLLDALR